VVNGLLEGSEAGSDARKAELVRLAGGFSLCAQQDQLPYKYVTVEGPVIRV
jgi:hypothetical protein